MASLVPSTESEPSFELPVTDGLPPWQLAVACALTPLSCSSGPAGATSAASAGRMSTVPIAGTSNTPPPGSPDRSSDGSAGSGSATDSSPSPADALATCDSGSAPVNVVRANSAPPDTAGGVVGRAAPASFAAHPSAPRLAVTGSTAVVVATVTRRALESHWNEAAWAGVAASRRSADVPMASGRERCIRA